MERIGLFQKVTGGRKAEFRHDVIVVLGPVRPAGSSPCDAHVLSLEISIELFAQMHVADQRRTDMPCQLIHVENALRGYLGARGVGTIGGGEIVIAQLGCGLVGIGDAGLRQWRIRPPLQTVVSIEERLSVTDEMEMKQHAFMLPAEVGETHALR